MLKRYSKFMIVLHWTTALLVVGAYIVSKDAREVRLAPPTLHFAFGLSVLLLLVPRLITRIFADNLPLATPASWLAYTATWAHRALYLLLIVVPLTGWYAASRLGVEISIFGLTIPPIAHAVDGRPGPIAGLHPLGGNLLLLLAGLHAALGLWHHFVRRDGTLGRMSPFRGNAWGLAGMLAACLSVGTVTTARAANSHPAAGASPALCGSNDVREPGKPLGI